MSFFEKLFGSFSDKELKRINPLKDKVLALEPEMAKLTDDELKAKTTEFKERLAKGETLDDLLPERSPYAVRPTGAVLGMKPYLCRSSAASCCTAPASPRCRPVKARRWSLPCPPT